MRFHKKKEDRVEADMTPMIDMVFQLIAFFMVLINFTEAEQDDRIQLPASQLAKPPDQPFENQVTLQLTRDEHVIFAGDKVPLPRSSSAPTDGPKPAKSRNSSRNARTWGSRNSRFAPCRKMPTRSAPDNRTGIVLAAYILTSPQSSP